MTISADFTDSITLTAGQSATATLQLKSTVIQPALLLPVMQGLLDLGICGGGLSDILPETGVLLGFALLFFIAGVWRFRYE